jgi:hypothetical protein
MRRTLAFLVVALGFLSPGCTVIENGVRVASTDLRDCVDDARERHRNRKLAEATWKPIAQADPCKYSPDHARGFVDGFSDYLFWGKEEPPVVPPARYRGFSYQTPQGYQAIEDWFDGYRHGVAMAVESGYRRLVTGPVSTTLPEGPERVLIVPVPAPGKNIDPAPPAAMLGRPDLAPLATQTPLPEATRQPDPPSAQAAPTVEQVLPAARFAPPSARDLE